MRLPPADGQRVRASPRQKGPRARLQPGRGRQAQEAANQRLRRKV